MSDKPLDCVGVTGGVGKHDYMKMTEFTKEQVEMGKIALEELLKAKDLLDKMPCKSPPLRAQGKQIKELQKAAGVLVEDDLEDDKFYEVSVEELYDD